MARMTAVAIIAIVTTISVSGWAQSNQDLANENAQLKSRVEKLEKEVQGLAGGTAGQGQQSDAGAAKKPLWSSLDIQFYGYVKADASYDDSRTNPGNFVLWVENEATNNNDDEFNLTANQTRMGFNITGPSGDTMKTSGKIEWDFYGSGAEENRPKLQLRHGYMTLDWPQNDFSLLAGQTADVISPLLPTTLNYTVLWDTGNIGYRRPQIRATKTVQYDQATTFQFQGAIVRTLGRDDLVGSETGEDSGFPTLQGRVSLATPLVGSKPTTIGLSGHCGREEYDLDDTGTNKDFDTWSINLDVIQPVCKGVTLKAELFKGENLDTYLGGIGQGVNTTALKEIASKGGWVAASFEPWNQWSFNVGAGVDDVDRDDVDTGDRTYNSSVFGNAIYAVNKHVQVGCELSHWKTHYKGPGDADDLRVQTSFIYKF